MYDELNPILDSKSADYDIRGYSILNPRVGDRNSTGLGRDAGNPRCRGGRLERVGKSDHLTAVPLVPRLRG